MFFLYDIVVDLLRKNESGLHLAIEGMVFIATLLVLTNEIVRVMRLRSDLHQEQNKVARLSGHLADVIERDFASWGLTDSEREIAILLIKGLSMQEIGTLRGVKEKTVRQQATSIYAKSNCPNRHELAAKFIEDLLNMSAV